MFYLIDKPLGISSFDVIRKLRKILKVKKMGHAGTLDPLATGCLLIATENSTKLLPLLEGSNKTYVFTVDITGSTPSLDLGTEITKFETEIYLKKDSNELKEFLLKQKSQVPPKYSAIHIDGKRAYDLARKEVEFEMHSRNIEVKDVEIISYDIPICTISLRISSGGYIRSLAPTIGEFFGAPGGHITMLRRVAIHTNSGDITIDMAHPIDSILPESNLDRSKIFPEIKVLEIDSTIQKQLEEGRIIEKIDGIQGIIGKQYFLDAGKLWSSLVQYEVDGFHIIRNNV